MLKAFGRLAFWVLMLLLVAAVVAVWAMAPRHFPGSVACRDSAQPRAVFLPQPGSFSLIVNDCLLSSGRAQEIRAWYNTTPFAPVAGLSEFPRWSVGRLSFTISRSLNLEPAQLHLTGPAGDTAGRLITAIVAQASYTFSW